MPHDDVMEVDTYLLDCGSCVVDPENRWLGKVVADGKPRFYTSGPTETVVRKRCLAGIEWYAERFYE